LRQAAQGSPGGAGSAERRNGQNDLFGEGISTGLFYISVAADGRRSNVARHAGQNPDTNDKKEAPENRSL
jgi:hypothetical protein